MKNIISNTLVLLLYLLAAPCFGQWTNFQPASNVLGQPDFISSGSGTGLNQLNGPAKAVVDPATGKVFVSELINNRILRFSSAAAFLNGATAEGFFGTGVSGTSQTQFNVPQGIAIDSGGRLWVADRANNRILRFDNAATAPNSPPASAVLGQPDFTSNAAATTQNGMNSPNDVSVDAAGRLWVSEFSNHRVLRFDNAASKPNGGAADGVLGQPDFTSSAPAATQTGMNQASGVYADTLGRLWITDAINNRVLRFDNAALKVNGGAADGVLGQPDFTSSAPGLSQTGMNYPLGVFIDLFSRLYVVDYGNNRLLIFNGAATIANGSPASNVLGQPNFTSNTPNNGGISASTLNFPVYPFFVESTRSLFVADFVNNRVLRFTAAGPTAAGLSVSGKVRSGKNGITRAIVSVTDANGTVRAARTNSFGFYRFENLPAGETYVFNATAKGFYFAPRIVTLNEDLSEFNFEALE